MQTMIQLGRALDAWGTAAFKAVLKEDIEQLDAKRLPLQQGLSHSSYACDDDIKVVIISVAEASGTICARAGIFYSGVIAGCNCADDPTPADTCPEYCEIQIDINTLTADTVISLLPS
jgi:hypothetical protein